MGSSRLQVLISDGAKDAPVPRPNKRPRLDHVHGDETKTSSGSKGDEPTQGPQTTSNKNLDEFIAIMQPRKGPSWADRVQPVAGSIPSTSELSVFGTNKPPEKVPEQKSQADMQVEEDEGPSATEPLSDLEWMRQRMSMKVDQVGRAFEQDDDEDANITVGEDKPLDIVQPEPQDPTMQTILQTSRLFLRNLAFSCTKDDLRELLSPFGDISQIHIPVDIKTKEPKGLAYVTFVRSASAVEAYEALDRKSFQGRLLHILAAVDRRGNIEIEGVKKKSLKDDRTEKKKSMAGKEFNWSMLYMNADAVASSIADRMSVSKSDILNPDSEAEGSNPAVRLALAETHVINETKAYLETHGVNLSSFSVKARSDTTILVKNIPYGTTEAQIRELFEPHGALTRVIVPPTGTIAVVDFERSEDAREGFKRNSVVYLEKGPLSIWEGASPPNAIKDQHILSKSIGPTVKILDAELESRDVEEPASVTDARPKKPGVRLSMGYGFSMQGFVLDGHSLVVKFAGRGREDDVKGSEASKGGKTMAKMIKDIRDLFGSQGQLKSVRLPKKFDSRTRGFAFLEFNAFNALRHTHLLGRHLVLEWAQEEEQDIDELRKKAGVGFGDGKAMPGKKRKVDMDMDIEGGEE
ncbi:hypothetical protein BDQ17DRAFT_1351180 [Cyathus striatus]|nr:hypothetical protein BDQ17DRAFT_1351180 [Cyathus striatus]